MKNKAEENVKNGEYEHIGVNSILDKESISLGSSQTKKVLNNISPL